MLLPIIAGCRGEGEPLALPVIVPVAQVTQPQPTYILADQVIRLGFVREPEYFLLDVVNKLIPEDNPRKFFPYDVDFNIQLPPVSDVEELVHRLALPSDNDNMVNAVIASFGDFARIYQAGYENLHLVSVLSRNGTYDFTGLFLRTELAGHDHISSPLVTGVVRTLHGSSLPEYRQVNNYHLLPWDNSELILAMRSAWDAIGEEFTREHVNSIFLPKLIPPATNAEVPTITYMSANRYAFVGEFEVKLSVAAMSPDGGELSFQWYRWYSADIQVPIVGAISSALSVFGDSTAPHLSGGRNYEESVYFVRITNYNPTVAGAAVAIVESEKVTITLVHQLPTPPYVLLYEGEVRFAGMPRGDTRAVFYDDRQIDIIRNIVNNHVIGAPIRLILIEGGFNSSQDLDTFTPSGNDLQLCQNRADRVMREMRNMGVYVEYITARYNPNQDPSLTPDERRVATIRIYGWE